MSTPVSGYFPSPPGGNASKGGIGQPPTSGEHLLHHSDHHHHHRRVPTDDLKRQMQLMIDLQYEQQQSYDKTAHGIEPSITSGSYAGQPRASATTVNSKKGNNATSASKRAAKSSQQQQKQKQQQHHNLSILSTSSSENNDYDVEDYHDENEDEDDDDDASNSQARSNRNYLVAAASHASSSNTAMALPGKHNRAAAAAVTTPSATRTPNPSLRIGQSQSSSRHAPSGRLGTDDDDEDDPSSLLWRQDSFVGKGTLFFPSQHGMTMTTTPQAKHNWHHNNTNNSKHAAALRVAAMPTPPPYSVMTHSSAGSSSGTEQQSLRKSAYNLHLASYGAVMERQQQQQLKGKSKSDVAVCMLPQRLPRSTGSIPLPNSPEPYSSRATAAAATGAAAASAAGELSTLQLLVNTGMAAAEKSATAIDDNNANAATDVEPEELPLQQHEFHYGNPDTHDPYHRPPVRRAGVGAGWDDPLDVQGDDDDDDDDDMDPALHRHVIDFDPDALQLDHDNAVAGSWRSPPQHHRRRSGPFSWVRTWCCACCMKCCCLCGPLIRMVQYIAAAESLHRSFCYGAIDGTLTGSGIVATFSGMQLLSPYSPPEIRAMVTAFAAATCFADAACMAVGHIWTTHVVSTQTAKERWEARLLLDQCKADAKGQLVDLLLQKGMLKIDAMSLADTLEGYPDLFVSALIGDSLSAPQHEAAVAAAAVIAAADDDDDDGAGGSSNPIYHNNNEHPMLLHDEEKDEEGISGGSVPPPPPTNATQQPWMRSFSSHHHYYGGQRWAAATEEEWDPEAAAIERAFQASKQESACMLIGFSVFAILPSLIYQWIPALLHLDLVVPGSAYTDDYISAASAAARASNNGFNSSISESSMIFHPSTLVVFLVAAIIWCLGAWKSTFYTDSNYFLFGVETVMVLLICILAAYGVGSVLYHVALPNYTITVVKPTQHNPHHIWQDL